MGPNHQDTVATPKGLPDAIIVKEFDTCVHCGFNVQRTIGVAHPDDPTDIAWLDHCEWTHENTDTGRKCPNYNRHPDLRDS